MLSDEPLPVAHWAPSGHMRAALPLLGTRDVSLLLRAISANRAANPQAPRDRPEIDSSKPVDVSLHPDLLEAFPDSKPDDPLRPLLALATRPETHNRASASAQAKSPHAEASKRNMAQSHAQPL